MTRFAATLIFTLFCGTDWTVADYIPNSGNWYSGQNAQVATAFIQNGIVPDAIDTPPLQQLTIAFNRVNFVTLGNELTPAGVITQPVVFWPVTSANQLYTLVELDVGNLQKLMPTFVDLDAPSRTNASYRSVLHWLVYNIPGNDVSRGEVYAPYMGSAPFANTGFLRYVLLVFPQTG